MARDERSAMSYPQGLWCREEQECAEQYSECASDRVIE